MGTMRSNEDLRAQRSAQLLSAGRWLQRNGDSVGAQQLFDQAADREFPAYARAPGSIVEVTAPVVAARSAPPPSRSAAQGELDVPEAAALTRLTWRGSELWLEAEGGPVVWVAIDDEVPLHRDAEVRLGGRRLRFRHLDAGGFCVDDLNRDGQPVCTVLIHQAVFTIGREGCDLAFPRDPEVAPAHCEITPGPFGSFLRSLAPRSGTFLRLPVEGGRVQAGTRVLIDQQLYRVETGPLGLALI